MKRYKIVTAKKYTKNGEEKTSWNTVGTLVYFEETQERKGGYSLELNMFPDTKFFVFEQKEKDAESKESRPSDNINTNDIPF